MASPKIKGKKVSMMKTEDLKVAAADANHARGKGNAMNELIKRGITEL